MSSRAVQACKPYDASHFKTIGDAVTAAPASAVVTSDTLFVGNGARLGVGTVPLPSYLPKQKEEPLRRRGDP